MTYNVTCLDVYDPAVREVWNSMLPEGFKLTYAETYEDDEQMRIAENADFIVTGRAPVKEKMLRSMKKVKLIQKFGIGYDKIDIETARKLNVPVAIAAGSNKIPVAELSVGLMIAVYRRIAYIDRQVRAGNWLKTHTAQRARAYILYGKTIGIIGCGNTGKREAKLLTSFDANVLYYDIVKLSPEMAKELHATFTPFDELIKTSDIISLHVPLTPITKRHINKDVFLKMKRSAILINTARGDVVNEEDLIWALKEGVIAGAGLDVLDQEPPKPDNTLFQMDNVVNTPHVAGGTVDNVANVVRHAFGNIKRIVANEPLPEQDVIVAKK